MRQPRSICLFSCGIATVESLCETSENRVVLKHVLKLVLAHAVCLGTSVRITDEKLAIPKLRLGTRKLNRRFHAK